MIYAAEFLKWLQVFGITPGGGGGGDVTKAQVQQSAFNFNSSAGSSEAYTVTLSPAPVSLTDGLEVSFLANFTNTSSHPTLNLNGLGAIQIFNSFPGQILATGDIQMNRISTVKYNTAANLWFLQNPLVTGNSAGYLTMRGEFNQALDDSGSPTAYTASNVFYDIDLSDVENGTPIYFQVQTQNSGAATLDYNGIGAFPIEVNGNPLDGGELLLNRVYLLFLIDSTWQLVNPSVSPSGVTPAQIQSGIFVTASSNGGTGNAYTAGLTPALGSLNNGTAIRFSPQSTNTNDVVGDTATLDVDGTGVHNLYFYSLETAVPLFAGALQSGFTYDAVFDGSNWIVLNPSNVVGGEFLVTQAWTYAEDSGTTNDYQITIPVLLLNPGDVIIPGTKVKFKPANTNGAPSTLTVNGSPGDIVLNDGVATALSGGEVIEDTVVEVTYLNGNWVLMNPPASGGGGVTALQVQQNAFNTGTDSSAVTNEYVVADISPPLVGYTNGLIVSFTPALNCSGASTLDAGFGALPIYKGGNGTGIINTVTGDIFNGINANCMCMGGFWMLLNPCSFGPIAAANTNSAFGPNVTGAGSYSLGFGENALVNGDNAFAFGNGSYALGTGSVAIGYTCRSFAEYSYSFGNEASVTGIGSWVQGDSNITPVTNSLDDQWNATYENGYRWFLDNSPKLAMEIEPTTGYLNALNVSGTTFIPALATTTTSGATTTLTVDSEFQQYFDGATTQTVEMPDVTTLKIGQGWRLVNRTTYPITINSSGSDLITTLGGGSETLIVCRALTGTDAAPWDLSTPSYMTNSWTPVPHSLTVVGTPTYTAVFVRTGRLVTCSIEIGSSGTTSSVQGVTNFDGFPFTPDLYSFGGQAFDKSNGVFLGNCFFNGVALYTPTWTAIAAVDISFSYFATTN